MAWAFGIEQGFLLKCLYAHPLGNEQRTSDKREAMKLEKPEP